MLLTPYIYFDGNAEEAMNFYVQVLGGKIVYLQRFGDSPVPSDEDHKDKVLHGQVRFGNNVLLISDGMKSQKTAAGNIQLSLEFKAEENIDEVFESMAEGGKISMPLQDMFWGARFGMLQDKFGVNWMFNKDKKA